MLFCYSVLYLLLLCSLIFVNKHKWFASCCSGVSLLKKKQIQGDVMFENPHQDVVSSAVFSFRGWVGKRPFTRSKLLRFVHMTLRSLDQVKGLKQNSRKRGLVTINIFCIKKLNNSNIYQIDFLLWMTVNITGQYLFLFSRSYKQCNKYYRDVCINSFKLDQYLLMVLRFKLSWSETPPRDMFNQKWKSFSFPFFFFCEA